jgi:lysophospholipase L1-like esterase
VRITGDTAVVTGRLVVAGEFGQKFGEIDETTDTLVRENGRWQAVARALVRLLPTARTAIAPLWRDGGNWLKRHAEFARQAKQGGVDLLFVGDSITDAWRTRGQAVWAARYGRLHAANIGISGDRTQHVLWRLDHGEVDGLHPKVVVLMIGTNNTGLEGDRLTLRNSPAEAAEGVAAVVNDLRQKLPEAKILLLAVFPRSHLPTDAARGEVVAINERIAGLDDGSHVHYLDIGSKFLTADGTLEPDIMPDYLHPSARGYAIWADAMQPTLDRLLAAGH